jgi:S-adenosylmethionine decarboxylase
LNSVSDFLSAGMTSNYHINEHSFHQQNLFHAKLSRKEIRLNDYLFEEDSKNLLADEQQSISEQLKKEIHQLFTNTN